MNLSQSDCPVGSAASSGHGRSLSSRLMGVVPWVMIAGLLYAGLFIKPKASGSAVVPPSIERRDLLPGIAVLGKSVWLAGNFGKVLKSTDGGNEWRVQNTAAEAHLQDIEAWDAAHAVAVGNNGTILVTANGGESWRAVPVELSDVANKLLRVKTGPAEGEGWAVGEMGAILHTADYGLSWTLMRAPEDVIMGDIDVTNPDNIWVVGEYGRMFHSRDRGATWDALRSATPASLTAVEFRDRSHGVAVGLDGAILWTEDGGGSWNAVPQSQSSNRQHLFGVKWDKTRQEWLAVGAKGVWVGASADLGRFANGRLSARDLAAHTEIAHVDGRWFIAGASPGIWDQNKAWQSLIGK